MESQSEKQAAGPPVQQTQQQQQSQSDAVALPPLDPNAMNPDVAAQLGNNFMNPDQMAQMLAGQPFIPDMAMSGMSGMPMSDPSLMMPMMMGNGNVNGAPAMPQPSSISAGKQALSISHTTMSSQTAYHLQSDDIALYDRQIRLWGVAAQAKIQNANILLITVKALANEVAKNLVLAGIGSLTILDDASVTEADLGAQFFLSENEGVVGQNRAQAALPAIQKLNPRVKVFVDTDNIKAKGPSYFAMYDVVVATDLDPDTFNLINTATRLNGKAFYAASTYGMYGFIFSDLIEHDYVIERDLGNIPTEPKQETRTRAIVDVKTRKEGTKTVESVTKRELYSTWFLASDVAVLPDDYTKNKRRLKGVTPALSCLRALWEFMQLQGHRNPGNREDLKMFTQIATQKHKALSLPGETLKPEFLRSFLQNLGSEIAPVAAILGGQLAQDVINVLGQKEQPIQNLVVFDGTTMESLMYPLHPEGTLGASLLSLGGGDAMVTNGGAGMPGGDMMMGMGLPMPMPGVGFDANGNMAGIPPPSNMMMGGMATDGSALAPMPNAPVENAIANGNVNPPVAEAPTQPPASCDAGEPEPSGFGAETNAAKES
jgi:ubiquitin-like 1-activating enzyme E1 A